MTGKDPFGRAMTFMGRRLPTWADARLFTIAPGHERIYEDAEWRGALVVVERGAVELECVGGSRWRFREGDLLYLGGLPLRALHNSGSEPVLLSAVSRK